MFLEVTKVVVVFTSGVIQIWFMNMIAQFAFNKFFQNQKIQRIPDNL